MGDHLLGVCRWIAWPHFGTVRRAQPGEEQTEVVVDLGERAERAPRAGLPGMLVDGDGRRQALDQVDVGPLELVEKLAGVTRKALDVPPLPLGDRSCRRPASSSPSR